MAHDAQKPKAPGFSGAVASGAALADAAPLEHDLDDAAPSQDVEDETILYSAPFEPRSFGAELVWAKGEHYVAKILRVGAGQIVKVSALRRRDMVLLLTGGRATIESFSDTNTDAHDIVRNEMMPGVPLPIQHGVNYRLCAMTDVELFTVYSEAV